MICAGEEETSFPQTSVLDSTNPEEQTKPQLSYDRVQFSFFSSFFFFFIKRRIFNL